MSTTPSRGSVGGGPQQPSQAEGDGATIDQDLREKFGDAAGADTEADPHHDDSTPTARDPRMRPSQAEGEREDSQ